VDPVVFLLLLALIGVPVLLGLTDSTEGPSNTPAESLKEGPVIAWLLTCCAVILWATARLLATPDASDALANLFGTGG